MKTATKTQTTRQRKAECECGCIIRMSRKAMVEHGLPTCACGGAFVPELIEDAALFMTNDELRDHPAYAGELDRFIVPETKCSAGSTARPRCGDCQSFRTHGSRCKNCGSTRSADTGHMNPRAARMVAAHGNVGVSRAIGEMPF